MSEEDQMMQAIALSLGENFPMVVDQVIYWLGMVMVIVILVILLV